MSLQTELQRIGQEFTAAFPITTITDRNKSKKMNDFLDSKIGEFIPEDADASFYSSLIKYTADNAPAIYSFSKFECIVSAVSYENAFRIGDHVEASESGVVGIDKPKHGYSIEIEYFTGPHLKISDKSTAAEWQAYLGNTFAVCAQQYPYPSHIDIRIEEFKEEITGKILASFGEQVSTEL